MKKSKILAYGILGIAFILFNIIVFAVPTVKTPTIWISYVFTVIAFILQIAIWNVALRKGNLKSKFLGISTISVGVIYLLVQLVSFGLFNVYPLAPEWIAVVASSTILGLAGICLIGNEIAKDEIGRVEKKVDKKVQYIKEIYTEVKILADNEKEQQVKDELEKLADKIKFSDPMSAEELMDIESSIKNKIDELKVSENKRTLIDEVVVLLNERNSKAKILK